MQKLQNQSGRSMVEMLGVLGIIGVLSVGGIAGYKTAMEKISMNKFFSFLDRVMMAAETENGSANSLFDADSDFPSTVSLKTGRNEDFCARYGSEYCANGVANNSTQKFLFGYGQFNWNIKPREACKTIGLTACQNFAVIIENWPSESACQSIMNVLENQFNDAILGFS